MHEVCGGNIDHVRAELSSGVQCVVRSEFAFAALKTEGSVISWGHWESGGNSDCVREELASGVRQVPLSQSQRYLSLFLFHVRQCAFPTLRDIVCPSRVGSL